MARIMFHAKQVLIFFIEAVSTACYIINSVYLQLGMKQTPYEIGRGKKLNLKFMLIF